MTEGLEDLLQWIFIICCIGGAAVASVFFWTTVANLSDKLRIIDVRTVTLQKLFVEIVMQEILNADAKIETCNSVSPNGNKCSRNVTHLNHSNVHATVHACYSEEGEICETWTHVPNDAKDVK